MSAMEHLAPGKALVLGLQHMFAMFGATVLVPIITGLDIGTTLFTAGVGTLLFHLVTRGKVPAFLGSSFAFLGGYAAVAPRLADGGANVGMLPYACAGVACAGVLYLVMSGAFRLFGAGRVMRYFPPVVTGPIIIAIGLILAPTAVRSCESDWGLAATALGAVVVFSIWGRGWIRILPILLGLIVSYGVAVCMGAVDFRGVGEAAWFGIPLHGSAMVWGNVSDKALLGKAIVAVAPIAIATMMEHIGDILAISSTVGKNFVVDPGLHRTMAGDGLATMLAAVLGGPANTTYGENTGVLALTKVYHPVVIRLAACFAVGLSFCPKFAAVIHTIPGAVVGGISFVLYGMISAVGIRNLVESRVDFSKERNLIVAAVILVIAIGGASLQVKGTRLEITSLALAALVGILLNAIFPEKRGVGVGVGD